MLDEQSADGSVDRRRVLFFLGIAFGIAWAFGLLIHLTGGLTASPVLVEGTQVTLAQVLLATGYIVVTRARTRHHEIRHRRRLGP